MKPLQMTSVHVVLYEGHGSRQLESEDRATLIGTLLDEGHAVTCTGTNGQSSNAWASADPLDNDNKSVIVVMGRFGENGTPQLEDAAGQTEIRTFDLEGIEISTVADSLTQLLDTDGVTTNRPGKWKPWFPVIDYSRCTNCMQCLSFCLFDVYGTSTEGKIQVQNNDNCKTDCPACSRVCPEVAIMFPKYTATPINGAEVKEDDLKRESMKVDISALLGGDLYGTLRKRSDEAKQRFAKERDDKRAMSERMRCLSKMVKDGTIPVSALNTLPSKDEIESKAAAATEKARAAIAANEQNGEGPE